MLIDHTRAMIQRGTRMMPVVHMDIDRHITCKGCGAVMFVSSRVEAEERLAKVLAGIKTTESQSTDGKQALGVTSK